MDFQEAVMDICELGGSLKGKGSYSFPVTNHGGPDCPLSVFPMFLLKSLFESKAMI